VMRCLAQKSRGSKALCRTTVAKMLKRDLERVHEAYVGMKIMASTLALWSDSILN
jgi:hypothetical protein